MADFTKDEHYRDILKQAVRNGEPLCLYGNGDYAEGLYKLDGNKLRRLRVIDVENMRRELENSNQDACENS